MVKDLAGRRLKWSHSWSSKPGTWASSESESRIRRRTSLYTSSFWRWWRGFACDWTALLPQLSMSFSITMSVTRIKRNEARSTTKPVEVNSSNQKKMKRERNEIARNWREKTKRERKRNIVEILSCWRQKVFFFFFVFSTNNIFCCCFGLELDWFDSVFLGSAQCVFCSELSTSDGTYLTLKMDTPGQLLNNFVDKGLD
jgi:hypothetical protein